MKTKFTKGEWVADIRVGCCAVYTKESRDECEQGLHNDDRNIFYADYPNVTVKGDTNQSVEAISNAHLIAAAPEMYNLLERLTSHDNCKKDIIHLLGEADNLLAKARGE